MNIAAALEKLNEILPLTNRQRQLPAELKSLHQDILFSLAKTGKVANNYNLDDLKVLNEYDLIVLSQDNNTIRGAYPFSLNKTRHKIVLENTEIYAMCALDAIAIAPVFNLKTKILSKCHVSNEKIEIQQDGDTLIEALPSLDLHVGIKWQQAGVCAADSLCMEMVFLKDNKVASEWKLGDNKSIFSLNDAIKFSIQYFEPLVN